jgi:hypothetical protein
MIQDVIAYMDALNETWRLFNGEHAIDMGLLDGIRTSGSYSQVGQVMHFLENCLTWSWKIVILTSLPSSTAKVVIDVLFMVLQIFLPVLN